MKFFLLFLLVFTSYACINQEQHEGEIVAYIDFTPIYRAEMDQNIHQELYDELCRIYLIRQAALNDLIKKKIYKQAADAQQISVDSLFNQFYRENINDDYLLQLGNKYRHYIKRNTIPQLFYSVDAAKEFNKIIKAELRDSLYNLLQHDYKVSIKLKAPESPRLNIKYKIKHQKGNIHASVSCLIISDFECPSCKQYAPIIDSIYSKYKHSVNFIFTPYGTLPTPSFIAAESAARQNKFWDMYTLLIQTPYSPDSSDVIKMASSLGLDTIKFKEDYKDPSIRQEINSNIELISASGIYGTPTIAVNNHIIFNSSSFEDIEHLLLQHLNHNLR